MQNAVEMPDPLQGTVHVSCWTVWWLLCVTHVLVHVTFENIYHPEYLPQTWKVIDGQTNEWEKLLISLHTY